MQTLADLFASFVTAAWATRDDNNANFFSITDTVAETKNCFHCISNRCFSSHRGIDLDRYRRKGRAKSRILFIIFLSFGETSDEHRLSLSQ